jgi:hypothetical protein
MTPSTRYAASGLAVAGLVAGFVAARFWFRSARVELEPPRDDPPSPHDIEPVLPELRQLWFMADQYRTRQRTWAAHVRANRETGRLNAIAAALTAVTLVRSTLSGVVGLTG